MKFGLFIMTINTPNEFNISKSVLNLLKAFKSCE